MQHQHEDLRILVDAIVSFDYTDEDRVVIGDHVLDLGEPVDYEQAREFVLFTRIARALHPTFEMGRVNDVEIVTDYVKPIEERKTRLAVDLSLDQMSALLEVIQQNREDAEMLSNLNIEDLTDDNLEVTLDVLRKVESELMAMVG